MVKAPIAVTEPPKVIVGAVMVLAPVNVTGPAKLNAPALLKLPSIVVGPVLSKRNAYASSPADTELAKRKEPEPLLIQVSFTKVIVVSLRPNTMAWSVLRMVPATLKALGAVATKPPAKCRLSDSTPPS